MFKKELSMVSCQKGPTRHAYAWQIGPFWQDTLVIWLVPRRGSYQRLENIRLLIVKFGDTLPSHDFNIYAHILITVCIVCALIMKQISVWYDIIVEIWHM